MTHTKPRAGLIAKPLLSSMLSLLLVLVAGGCDDADAAPDGGVPGDDAGPSDADTDASPDASSDATTDANTGATITIAFEHLANGIPVALGTDTPYTNAFGNDFGVTRLSYFVSAMTLTFTDGSEVTAPGGHYVDHETAETRTFVLPVLPGDFATDALGDLAEVSFVMGLGPDLNITGAFPSAPESLMEWPEMMGGGYHYIKFEGRYLDDTEAPFNFMTHSGGLGGADYSFEVVLDGTGHTLVAGTDGTTLTLEMNLDEWFTAPNTWDLNDYFNETHRGIMGNADAQASLQANGSTVFSLGAP